MDVAASQFGCGNLAVEISLFPMNLGFVKPAIKTAQHIGFKILGAVWEVCMGNAVDDT